MDSQRTTRCQQFLTKYQEFASDNTTADQDELFNMTLETVKQTSMPTEEEKVNAGDSALAASFKNALNQNKIENHSRDKNTKIKIDMADIVKD